MLFNRALQRELRSIAGIVFATLFTIMVTTSLVRFLGRAASGRVDSSSVLPLIAFSSINILGPLLVLTVFVAVLMTLTRAWRDSEMVIWQSAGQSMTAWIRPVLTFTAPFVLMAGMISFFFAPWANQQIYEYQQRFAEREDVSMVAAGQFRESSRADRVFFVESLNDDATEVRNVFVTQQRDGRLVVVVSRRGRIETREGGHRYLVLEKGRRYDGRLVDAEMRMMEFERYGLRIEPKPVSKARTRSKNKLTRELITSGEQADLGELGRRIGVPISAILLALLAIPLSAANPRMGRSINLVVALLLYMVYANLLSLSQAWVAQDKVPFWLGVWITHAGAVLVIVTMFWRRMSLKRLLPKMPELAPTIASSRGRAVRILRRYFARETFSAVAFVLAGFLALFTFFDFIAELEDIGRGNYQFQHAIAYVLLSLPNHIYELMPVATLIGAIYALAQFASNSEFTAMRAAGLSRRRAMMALIRVGLVLSVLTAIIGEGLAPPADRLAQDIRLGAMGAHITGQFRSGIWIRDSVRDATGRPSRQRFVNVGQLSPTGSLRDIRIFEFDNEMRLLNVLWAPNGGFTGVDRWDLNEVTELAIEPGKNVPPTAIRVKRTAIGDREWTSELTPELLSVIAVAPDRMSAWDLARYVNHLKGNKQDASRYELALWKKAVYPLAILVMMALALPFAYLHARAGSIGYKVFAGIMVGVAFHFLNGLFSHLGLLNTWPPWISVSIPSIVALAIALIMLSRVGGAR